MSIIAALCGVLPLTIKNRIRSLEKLQNFKKGCKSRKPQGEDKEQFSFYILHSNNNCVICVCLDDLKVFLLFAVGRQSRLFQGCFQRFYFRHEADDCVLTLRPFLKKRSVSTQGSQPAH